jgi:hypothetical protein
MFKLEKEIPKTLYLGLGLFFITYAMCRVFYFLYFIPFENIIVDDVVIFWFLGAFLGVFSLTWVVAVTESIVFTKSKHLITINFGDNHMEKNTN